MRILGEQVEDQRPKIRSRLRDSGRHRAEIEAARAWGVSRRRFLGWEPKRLTTYEHDDDGRLVRSVTEVEPEWTDKERAWAFALIEEEADTCSGCGQLLSETTRPEAEGGYDAGAVRCHACTQVHKAQAPYVEHDPMSLRFTVKRTW